MAMNDTLTLRLLYTVNKVVDMTTANAVWPRDGKAYSHFVEAGSFSGPPSRGLPFSMGSIWSHSVARGSDTDAREGARSCTESQRRASCVRRVRGEAMGNVETGAHRRDKNRKKSQAAARQLGTSVLRWRDVYMTTLYEDMLLPPCP